MSSTENRETLQTDFLEKVVNPKFSLLKFKQKLGSVRSENL